MLCHARPAPPVFRGLSRAVCEVHCVGGTRTRSSYSSSSKSSIGSGLFTRGYSSVTNPTQRNPLPTRKRRYGAKALLALVAGSAGLYYYLQNRSESQPGSIALSPAGMRVATQLPFRLSSRTWGKLVNCEFPTPINTAFLRLYASMFGCKLDEMVEPLESYSSLAAFFIRRLKEGVRPIDDAPLVSPVDGTVLSVAEVRDFSKVEQIKGIYYSLEALLGENLHEHRADDGAQKSRLYHCIIYLAPGDYHGIHSPVDWKVLERRHFPGYLFPVAPIVVNMIPGIFSINERVVLTGKWKEDHHFSLTFVGASNVGSITLSHEPHFTTNAVHEAPDSGLVNSLLYTSPQPFLRGEEVGFFNMGSTVVLVFESNKEFEFAVKPGDKVTLGKSLGAEVGNR